MYSEEDLMRLPVLNTEGSSTDDKIQVTDLEIIEQ
jgi:hypothetical protein